MLQFPIFRRAAHDEAGSVAVIVGVLIFAIVGFVGIGIETGIWFSAKRQMQNTADAAAAVAAFETAAGSSSATIIARVESEIVKAGMDPVSCSYNPASAADCAIYYPAQSAGAGNSSAIEVAYRKSVSPLVGQMFGVSGFNMQANSVMAIGSQVTETPTDTATTECIMALNGSVTSAVYMWNNAAVNCGVIVNSSSNDALHMENNSTIGGDATVVGSLTKGNGAVITGTATTNTGAAVADPFAATTVGTPPACTAQTSSASKKGTYDLTPGRFCDGWNFSNQVTLNLSEGTYYIDSQLSVQNNVTINGVDTDGDGYAGITIVINGSYTVTIGNNATWNIKAPKTGSFKGIVMYSPASNSDTTQIFQNNSVLNVEGALYFPSQKVKFNNNAVVTETGCTQVVADRVEFRNNAAFGTACTTTALRWKKKVLKTLH